MLLFMCPCSVVFYPFQASESSAGRVLKTELFKLNVIHDKAEYMEQPGYGTDCKDCRWLIKGEVSVLAGATGRGLKDRVGI